MNLNNKTKKQLVSLINLNKNYYNKTIFKEINLNIMAGDCLGILGKNNSGKTTLAKLIAKIESPSSGIIKYFFSEINNNNISFQYLNYNWPIGIKVKNLIDLYCGIYKIEFNDSWIQKLINLINFQNLLKININKLKNFEKELLTFLLALLCQPKLLILDEIATNLSFELNVKIFTFLKQQVLTKNLTIIIINPSPAQIEALCNKVVLINNFKIEELDVKAILKQHSNFKKYLINKIKD